MKCPYCAELIQDEAIVCRFCNATKLDGEWVRNDPKTDAGGARVRAAVPKGYLTFQISGVLLAGAAIFEVFALTSPVPLWGALRDGPIAVIYHAAYTVFFATVAFALFRQQHWGPRVINIGCAVVTLERIVYMLDKKARDAELARAAGGDLEILHSVIPAEALEWIMITSGAVTLVSWWGFAAYVHYRRAYFQPTTPS